MLIQLDDIENINPPFRTDPNIGYLRNLQVEFESKSGILWNYICESADPHFSHEVLDDIRAVQNFVRGRREQGVNTTAAIRHVVFASKIPGVFNLGGDLALFRELISNNDRTGLARYAKKATDAVFYHSSNYGDAMSFSLVQGAALGGGFEAALAGNVLVAERGTKLGFPEVLFGLFPGMGAYTLLRRRVDRRLAEEIILSAKNYSAEELFELDVVDLLCDAGEGEELIRSYVSRLASRSGVGAFRRALHHAQAVDRRELYSLADAWVDTALGLAPEHLRRIDRLILNQQKNFGTKDDRLVSEHESDNIRLVASA